MAAVPLRDAAAAPPDHPDRDAVFGHLHLRRLSAGLRAHPWRTAERDEPVRHLRLRYCDGCRPVGTRRLGGTRYAARARTADRRLDHLYAEGLMVTGYGRFESAVRVWRPVGFFLVLALF